MTPRGPDDEGHAEIRPRDGGQWTLGCRRLAILDLSAEAHQPMRDPVTGNLLVFNGEIYNFRELARELAALGAVFRSTGDTEVLLAGYRQWGEGIVARLRGMFAFAVWDQTRQSLFLARDRHGIKPLYYCNFPGGFLFASELRALLASGLIPRALDATGLDSYLKFGAVEEPATLIENVRLLPAGHLLRFSAGQTSIERFWSLPAPPAALNGSARERVRRVEELAHELREAVRIRLVSDVPLGVFLSGGLDSSVVAALAARASGGLRTFNVTFAESDYAEDAAARTVARHLQTEHHQLTLSQSELLRSLPLALAAMDQPSVDAINTFFVSRAAKQAGVTVALSGLGGDELFAGYRSFRLVPRMEQADRLLPGWGRRLAAAFLATGRYRKYAAWLGGRDGFPHPFYTSRLLFSAPDVARMLQPDCLLQVDFDLHRAARADAARLIAAHDPVNRVACLELSLYLRNTLLRDTDSMSMAHSLEVRVPLIDHRVTELALALPGAWKLDSRQRKPLLVAALDRPLPTEILRQPKRGFELPWDVWLRGELREEVAAALAEPGPVLGRALDWDIVRRLWTDFLRARVHWSRVWLFYVLRQWTARQIET